ncbi:protein of unknown function (plasmid) [Cupriavidus taiwanensis]|uniref:Uncharacterized protein n=1 Tax=Cupriavidus taiwanensis TaxID=164546 RepID=A0A375IW13_9BURK|nr:hypothetical protein CT19425_U460020 [Cupriavidus taiwanensis]SPK77602.1 protein of unknown function [Cupriavidus taiwanensis]
MLTRHVFSVCNDDNVIQFKVPPLRGQQLHLSLSNDATQATKHINFRPKFCARRCLKCGPRFVLA